MTFVAAGSNRDMRQVQTQLYKLINVTAVKDVTHEPTVVREMALIKVRVSKESRAEVMQIVDIFRASIVDVAMNSLIIQIVGPEDRVESLIKLLRSFGIEEMVRTGRVAMVRGENGVSFDEGSLSGHSNGHNS
jgi:acetolactate synthase-1/3 small subunit